MEKLVLLVWVVDALVKLLPGTPPPEPLPERIQLTCARNEWETAQIALRSNVDLEGVTVRATELRKVDGDAVIGSEHIRCQFVGFIPINHNTPHSPGDERIAKAPAEIPDVLLPDAAMKLKAERTQSVWVSLFVPINKPAGVYNGTVEVRAGDFVKNVPVELKVFDFDVPAERHLFVTNWFNTNNVVGTKNVPMWSDEYFAELAKCAKNMAEHRQNVFWIPPTLIKIRRTGAGALSYDYAVFDRYVETFLNAGVDGRIEIQHVAHFGEGGWSCTEIPICEVSAWDEATGQSVKLGPDEGMGPLLADLEKHLEARGWLERSMIHICDEPSLHNADAWRKASEFAHRHAPRIKTIDAIEGTDFRGALDVWVPKLSHYRNWQPQYDAVRADGNEMWYYICCHPTGRYMNRFLDYPLIKTRLLHWLNYRYDLGGYLHWGWNMWSGDAFAAPPEELPPGDRNTVYPGPDGPLNSLRWEAQRDSLEDFECLWLLEARQREIQKELGPAAASFQPEARSQEFCSRMVRSFVDYERDPQAFRSTREQLASEIVQSAQEPLALIETYPPENVGLLPWPTVIEVHGVTRPGAQVACNGKGTPVHEDGSFSKTLFLKPGAANVEVAIKVDDVEKKVTRTFHFAE